VGVALGPEVGTADIDRLFNGDRRAQARAYKLAGAMVRDLIAEHGGSLPAIVLARASRGVPFDRAFAEATGVPLVDAERRFWRRQRLWTTWIPFITSASALWMIVTLLALAAIRASRRKNAARRQRWEDEEAIWDVPIVAPPLSLAAAPEPDEGGERDGPAAYRTAKQ
jgi:hypothetical protein